MTYLDYLEQKVLLERLVIGLEEPILVKGLGELQAKIDSGNGGYNVIHGTDFHQQGSELMFTTHDSFGHDKKMQAKVIDTIEVNMGGGNIESRPVIELDIKFAGDDYRKIPFSVSDRSSNTHPILVSKGFVEKELEALIDVGAKNISNNGIEVVYGESFWKPSSDDSPVLKAGEKVNSFFNKLGKFGDYLAGNGENPFKKDKNTEKMKDMANGIANAEGFVKEDKEQITPKISGLTVPQKLIKDQELDTDSNVVNEWNNKKIDVTNFPVNLVTSYMMTKGSPKDKNEIKGLESERKAWKEMIDATKSKVAIEKERRELEKNGKETSSENQTEEQEESPSETNEISEDANSQDSSTNNNDDNFEEKTTQFEHLSSFTLWFISFEKDLKTRKEIEERMKSLQQLVDDPKKGQKAKLKLEEYENKLKQIGLPNKEETEKEIDEYIQSGKLDGILYKLFKSGVVNPDSVTTHVEKLAQLFQKDGKQGFFCLAYTPQSQTELKDEMKDVKREYHFFEDLSHVAYKKKDKSPQFDKAEEEIKKEEGIDSNDETNTDDSVSDESEIPEGEVTDELPEIVSDDNPEIVSDDVPDADGSENIVNDTDSENNEDVQTKSDEDSDDEDGLSEEDKEWIRKFNSLQANYNHEAEEEPVQKQEEDPWVTEKLNLLKSKGLM